MYTGKKCGGKVEGWKEIKWQKVKKRETVSFCVRLTVWSKKKMKQRCYNKLRTTTNVPNNIKKHTYTRTQRKEERKKRE